MKFAVIGCGSIGKRHAAVIDANPDPSEILKVWNSDFHKNMVKNIDINKCPRCTFGAYNEIVEKVIINDSMCKLFP